MPKKKENPVPETTETNPPAPENLEPLTAENSSADKAATTPKQRRRRTKSEPSAPILTLEVGADVETQKDKDLTIWHELKNSQLTGTPLSGILGKVERTEIGGLIAVVDYKGQRVAIPLAEMMLVVPRPASQSDDEYNSRISRLINGMMGAEIDFIVRGTDIKKQVAVASRKAAMMRNRRRYYIANSASGRPQIYPGRIVESRIVAVGRLAIRVEIFGVETPIRNNDLSWGHIEDCRENYFVGDSLQVRVNIVEGNTPETLRVFADTKSLTDNNTLEKLRALKPQTNCIGTVTDVVAGVIFITLSDGIRAIAHRCFDKRKPGRGDEVLFVCIKIDEAKGGAVGIVSRIIRRNI